MEADTRGKRKTERERVYDGEDEGYAVSPYTPYSLYRGLETVEYGAELVLYACTTDGKS